MPSGKRAKLYIIVVNVDPVLAQSYLVFFHCIFLPLNVDETARDAGRTPRGSKLEGEVLYKMPFAEISFPFYDIVCKL